MGNDRGKKPLFAASNRRPLPVMQSAHAPNSLSLGLAPEVSPEIEARPVENSLRPEKQISREVLNRPQRSRLQDRNRRSISRRSGSVRASAKAFSK
jgi:hypothetical protein